MRNNSGEAMMPVWRYKPYPGVYVAAWTREEAAELLAAEPEVLSRVKGLYATGKPRGIK